MFDMKSARYWAQELLEQALFPGARVIDGTMGNGYDTLWLCQRVGSEGKVYAFDIQPSAVEHTRARLQEAGLADRAELILDGHQHVLSHVLEPVDAVMFNLGWLPGAPHECTTRVETTLKAVSDSLTLLKPGALMTVCVYPGHGEGARELSALLDWAEHLDSARFSVMLRRYINQPSSPPVLIAVGKNPEKQRKGTA